MKKMKCEHDFQEGNIAGLNIVHFCSKCGAIPSLKPPMMTFEDLPQRWRNDEKLRELEKQLEIVTKDMHWYREKCFQLEKKLKEFTR